MKLIKVKSKPIDEENPVSEFTKFMLNNFKEYNWTITHNYISDDKTGKVIYIIDTLQADDEVINKVLKAIQGKFEVLEK